MALALNGTTKNCEAASYKILDGEAFFDAETMKKSFIEVYGQLACLLIQSQFLVADDSVSIGEIIYSENRLYVQGLPVLLMITGSAILSILSLSILFIAPRKATPQDPALLASHGTIIGRSVSFEQALLALGGSRTSELKRQLIGFDFKTQVAKGDSFCITTTQSSMKTIQLPGMTFPRIHLPDEEITSPPSKNRPWVPLFVQYPIVLLTFALPILSIIGLETVYQISQRDGGLLNAGSTLLYYVRYPSTFILLIIATLFNSLDFVLCSYAQFHSLQSDPSPGCHGIITNLIQMMPPVAWYRALCNRYFGPLASITTALIGSLLTIVGSGLWVVDSAVIKSATVSASVGTSWDVSWANSQVDDGGAGENLRNIMENSLSSPNGIWNDLVLPDIVNLEVEKNEIFRPSTNLSIRETRNTWNFTMSIPALRPQLRCEPATRITLNSTTGTIDAFYPLSRQCHGNSYRNSSEGKKPCRVSEENPYYGCFSNLHLDPDEPGFSIDLETYPDNPDECPSIGIMFGYSNPASNLTSVTLENNTALICYQEIREVDSIVSFRHPDVQTRDRFLKFGPTTIESVSINDRSGGIALNNGTKGVESFNFRIQNHLLDLDLEWRPDSSYFYSSIFNTLVYGPDNITQDTLIGPNNRQRLQDNVNRLYNQYMVQVINSPIFRKPVNTSSDQLRQLTGTVSTTVSRIKINFISKLILQILLAWAYGYTRWTWFLADGRPWHFTTRPILNCELDGALRRE
ncbi:hypothetical protein F5Y08DRAFT_347638 [Xylaria arbuscula]|nr:hypothetical protein F5Y08DRAFT_347638 [Xylaria arbuscula]